MVRFSIGKTNPDYVIAEFDDRYTTVNIYPNGDQSDGLTKDFKNPTAEPDYPIYAHRATLKTVIIQEGIIELGKNAFARTNITSISLPSTLKSINAGCFDNVKTLTAIELPEGLERIGPAAFRSCSALTTVNPLLPNKLIELGMFAFRNCSNLQGNIIIPNTLTIIEDKAFFNCSSLAGTITFSEGLTEIGYNAFSFCSKLTGGLHFPNTLRKISFGAFQACSKLNGEIVLNEGLEHIGDWSFNHCSLISNTELTIPSTVTVIGGDTETIYASESPTETSFTVSERTEGNAGIGTHVFYNFATKTMAEFKVAEGNINFKSVDGVLFSSDGTRIIGYPQSKPQSVYEIPEGVTKIDEMVFGRTGQSSLTDKLKKLILPDSYVIKTTNQETVIANRYNGHSLAVSLYSFNAIDEIEVKPTNPNYITIDGCLYDKTGRTLYYVPRAKVGSLRLNTLTSSVVLGALYGFEKANMSTLDELIIPRYVINIDDYSVVRLNNFIEAGKTVIIEDGNTVLAYSGSKIVKLLPISTGGLISNVKIITSGNVPTTSNLFKGELAFGKIGDKYEIYGNSDGTIQKLSDSSSIPNIDEVLKSTNGVSNTNIRIIKDSEFSEMYTQVGNENAPGFAYSQLRSSNDSLDNARATLELASWAAAGRGIISANADPSTATVLSIISLDSDGNPIYTNLLDSGYLNIEDNNRAVALHISPQSDSNGDILGFVIHDSSGEYKALTSYLKDTLSEQDKINMRNKLDVASKSESVTNEGGDLTGPLKITRTESSDFSETGGYVPYFEAVFDEDNATDSSRGFGRPFSYSIIKNGKKTTVFYVNDYGTATCQSIRVQTGVINTDPSADNDITNKKYVDKTVSDAVASISLKTLLSVPVSTNIENPDIVPTEGENEFLYFCIEDKKLYVCNKEVLAEFGSTKIYSYTWSVMMQPSTT